MPENDDFDQLTQIAEINAETTDPAVNRWTLALLDLEAAFAAAQHDRVTEADQPRNTWLDCTLDPHPSVAPVTEAPVTEAPVTEAPVTEAPVTEAPWRPVRGDLVRVTIDGGGGRAGELAMIDDVYGGGCGDPYCNSCANITALVIRPRAWDHGEEWHEHYLYIHMNEMEPVLGNRDGQIVRCRAHGNTQPHPMSSSCMWPIRVNGAMSDLINDELLPAFRVAWAPELQEREERRAEQRARMGLMVRGQRYMIDSTSSRFYGLVAEIQALSAIDDDMVTCNIFHPDGEYRRGGVLVNVFTLGSRWHASLLGRRVPSFIRFTDTRYSGSQVTVNDREIEESVDDHECEQHCFEYGCSVRVAQIVDHDNYNDPDCDCEPGCGCGDRDDEEPEYHAGGIPIHSYSYRPKLIFSGEGPVFMGTELELSTGSGRDGERNQELAARLITDAMGNLVYLKGDGSISGYGFEAVFHPMSYDWLVDNWPEDLLRSMRNAGAIPHDSCGMHVHVGRTAFSDPVHAFKWIKFMYRNQDQVVRMARRDPSTWGSFNRPDERAAAKWHAKGGYGAYNRYTAINCIPRDTYEVRIFASTLNRTRFLGSLGLIDASVEYTRQITTEQILKQGAWGFDPFRDYVGSFKKYAPLQREFARLLDR